MAATSDSRCCRGCASPDPGQTARRELGYQGYTCRTCHYLTNLKSGHHFRKLPRKGEPLNSSFREASMDLQQRAWVPPSDRSSAPGSPSPTTPPQMSGSPETSPDEDKVILIDSSSRGSSGAANNAAVSRARLLRARPRVAHAFLEKELCEQHRTALTRTSAAIEGARTSVEEERALLEQLRADHSEAFDTYCKQGPPSNLAEQVERNKMRTRLIPVVEETERALEFLWVSDQAAAAALQAEECAELAIVDGLIQRLGEIRAGMVQQFSESKREIERDHCKAKSIAEGFAPMMEHIDGFVRRYTKEVDEECAQSRNINGQMLEELNKQVRLFVSANESPSNNVAFARAQEDIVATENRLKEQSTTSLAAAALLKGWDALLAMMPSGAAAVVDGQSTDKEESASGTRSWWLDWLPRGKKRSLEA